MKPSELLEISKSTGKSISEILADEYDNSSDSLREANSAADSTLESMVTDADSPISDAHSDTSSERTDSTAKVYDTSTVYDFIKELEAPIPPHTWDDRMKTYKDLDFAIVPTSEELITQEGTWENVWKKAEFEIQDRSQSEMLDTLLPLFEQKKLTRKVLDERFPITPSYNHTVSSFGGSWDNLIKALHNKQQAPSRAPIKRIKELLDEQLLKTEIKVRIADEFKGNNSIDLLYRSASNELYQEICRIESEEMEESSTISRSKDLTELACELASDKRSKFVGQILGLVELTEPAESELQYAAFRKLVLDYNAEGTKRLHEELNTYDPEPEQDSHQDTIKNISKRVREINGNLINRTLHLCEVLGLSKHSERQYTQLRKVIFDANSCYIRELKNELREAIEPGESSDDVLVKDAYQSIISANGRLIKYVLDLGKVYFSDERGQSYDQTQLEARLTSGKELFSQELQESLNYNSDQDGRIVISKEDLNPACKLFYRDNNLIVDVALSEFEAASKTRKKCPDQFRRLRKLVLDKNGQLTRSISSRFSYDH